MKEILLAKIKKKKKNMVDEKFKSISNKTYTENLRY